MFSIFTSLSFDSPWLLLLLLPLPWVWKVSSKSLSGMARGRRLTAVLLRFAVLLLLVLALAEMQWVTRNKRLTVFYVIDMSRSIPAEARERAIEYANKAVFQHRRDDDKVGVIVFGREGVIEVPPFDDNLPLANAVESQLDPEHSNLEGAIKLAQATFPEDSASRIVVISDGNENVGDAFGQARKAADAGVSIDVAPIEYAATGDVLVEKVALPADVRKSEPFYLRVVLNNVSESTSETSGILTILQKAGARAQILNESHVTLPPGKKVFTVGPLEISQPDFYTYEATFVPDDRTVDRQVENNKAATYTHVQGAGKVLLIEPEADGNEPPNQFADLIETLRNANLEVDTMPSNALFTQLQHLAPYDTVILANVGREEFNNDQIEMLVQNTQQLGCGLVMLGGPNSFGAGGWTNSKIEEAMPVDFQIKDAKVVPKGALALVMHASEMPDGNYWQKVIAKEAIKVLGEEDKAGLIHYSMSGQDAWLWKSGLDRVGGNRNRMFGLIDRMVPGDMPQFDPGLQMAVRAFSKEDPGMQKHMIVISDGDPAPYAAGTIQDLRDLKVSVSSVSVGSHGVMETNVMKKLATDTGGKFYPVSDPRALPKIFQKEARRVARPLIYENESGFSAQPAAQSEMIAGLSGALPPITGLVMTQKKPHPLVELSLVAAVPEPNTPVLAGWVYGVGRAVALTTDSGSRWAKRWPGWANYQKLFEQVVRWSMRPAGDTGKYSIQTDLVDGRVRVLVTALDESDSFRNYLKFSGAVIRPDMKNGGLELRQTAPGRYVGEFDAFDQGTYHVALSSGPGSPPLRVGVNVPYSAEFRDKDSNAVLLENLAALTPDGGEPGKVIRSEAGEWDLESMLKVNSFRHDLAAATSRRDLWPMLLFAAGFVFFADVFVRRVAVDPKAIFTWTGGRFAKLLGRGREAAPLAAMERLRSKKAEITEQLEQRRAAARFEPAAQPPTTETSVLESAENTPPREAPRQAPAASLAPEKPAEDQSYTARLLKAKKKVWEERDQK